MTSGATAGTAVNKRVLLTGAAGNIGSDLRRHLRERYALRLMFHRTIPELDADEEHVVVDMRDPAALEAAVAGVDAVVHMAAASWWLDPWERCLELNVVASRHLFEACRRQGVKKIVFGSTHHVGGFYEFETVRPIPTTPDGLLDIGQRDLMPPRVPVGPDVPIRPDGYYGATKAFSEALAHYYADAFGISVIVLRIGSYLPRPQVPRNLATWCSPRDMAQLVTRSIETDVPWAIFYGISGNTRRYWDISNAQRLVGYTPEDDAEQYARELLGGRPE